MRKSALVGGVACVLVAACQLIVGIEDRDVARTEDGGGDTSTSPPDAGPRCPPLNVPPRPDASNDGGLDLAWALEEVYFGLDGGVYRSMNLDGRCTCPDEGSCRRPADAGGEACDDDAGGDNAASGILRILDGTVLREDNLNKALSEGTSGSVLRVEEYNGEPDDPYVVVSLYGALARDGGTWTLDRDSVEDAPPWHARSRTLSGYVAGGVLVAAFDFTLTVGGGPGQPPLRAALTKGHIVAEITKERAVGVLAGRWPTDNVLRGVLGFPDPLNSGAPICTSSATFDLVRGVVCNATDITSVESADRGALCDAISVNVAFVAGKTSLGPVGIRPEAGTPCPPETLRSCQ
ncbi:MAG: hypothetical protein JNM74_22555 [Myxococcales bacterium]|nr:hypothetical protein [Myxococcales bacterium]